jgi:hypothetical protein
MGCADAVSGNLGKLIKQTIAIKIMLSPILSVVNKAINFSSFFVYESISLFRIRSQALINIIADKHNINTHCVADIFRK